MEEGRAAHLARVRHLREAFASANERLVARLRGASNEAAERHVQGGWSAAQIGWHVATVSTRFAAMIAGDLAGGAAAADTFRSAPGRRLPSAIPERLQAPRPCIRRRRFERTEGGRGARGFRDEDGARLRRADFRARSRHGRHQCRRRDDQCVSDRRVGDGSHRPAQQAGETGARRGLTGPDQWCWTLRPQRRRFRNRPFREIPSIRAASSTRPCVLSSALLPSSARAARRRPAAADRSGPGLGIGAGDRRDRPA